MNPWTIIGWALITIIGIVVLMIVLKVVIICSTAAWYLIGHFRTRNNPPKKGQVWGLDDSDGAIIRIDDVDSDGRVHIKSGGASFSHSKDQWKVYVKNRRLRRVS